LHVDVPLRKVNVTDLDAVRAARGTLMVSELFGPTFQGEGPWSGRLAVFLRLGRCNLDCAWCDTPYTWDWTGTNGTVYDPAVELRRFPIDELVDGVVDLLPDCGTTRLVITGGEPLVQRRNLADFVSQLLRATAVPMFIDVETNGTQKPLQHDDISEDAICYVVSPKLPSSGVEWNPAWFTTIGLYRDMTAFGCAALKFVIGGSDDLKAALAIMDETMWPEYATWFMPEGRTAAEVAANAPAVADAALHYDVNYSDRLHVRLWGDERGR